MLSPIKTMFMHFPLRAYATVLFLCAGSLFAFAYVQHRYEQGRLSRKQGTAAWFLVNYLLLLLFFTVLARRSQDFYRYNFDAGYSYRYVLETGDQDMLLQIAANIAVFVPVGVLGSLAVKRLGFLKSLLLGIGVSLCIELLQLAMRNGTCEIDDLISNFIGTLCGCILVMPVRK